MNLFCRLFGHTWLPETRAPEPQWNTTKAGQVLVATFPETAVRHVEVCRRCRTERPAPPRRHDDDRPRFQPERLIGGEEEGEG
jgi:hypothetical protein